MGKIVIARYRPRAGKDGALRDLVRNHVPILRAEGLATERVPIAMRAQDGSIVEVFEWQSAEAIERAHANEAVAAMWGQFEAACTYEKLADLKEAREQWSTFEPVD